MKKPSDEILDAANALSVTAGKVSPEMADRVRGMLATRFGLDLDHFSIHLTADSVSVHNPKAWSWVGEFIGNNDALLLFARVDDSEVVRFSSGSDIVKVLSECTGFVFMICPVDGTYLLCFDDHDCLIAAGTAITWLQEQVKRGRDGRDRDNGAGRGCVAN